MKLRQLLAAGGVLGADPGLLRDEHSALGTPSMSWSTYCSDRDALWWVSST